MKYDYDPVMEEKIEYFHDPLMKILLKIFSLNYRCIFNNTKNDFI